jgi:hypothetical protein
VGWGLSYYPYQEPNENFWYMIIAVLSVCLWYFLTTLRNAPIL